METDVIKTETIFNTNDVKELVKIYSDFTNELNKYVVNKTYIDESGKVLPIYRLTYPIDIDINPDYLQKSGIRNIKRFKRYLKVAIKNKDTKSVNKLFNLVYKRILNLTEIPKMLCDKHDKIQKLRKDWLKQQEILDKILNDYKKEKGNFYKQF